MSLDLLIGLDRLDRSGRFDRPDIFLTEQQIHEDDFIHEERVAPLPGLSGVNFLRCRFTPANYDDRLFARYGVPFPRELQHAVARRKAEHLAGRYLCKKILQEHALPGVVPIGSFREPVWPPGWIGSITHAAGIAMSCMAGSSDVVLLGIDFEAWMHGDLAREIADTIIDQQERHMLSARSRPFPEGLSLAFSAKESFFKAAFPLVRRYFDFHCVRMMDIDDVKRHFRLQVMETLAPALWAGRIFEGSFRSEEEGVLTWVVQRPAPDFNHLHESLP